MLICHMSIANMMQILLRYLKYLSTRKSNPFHRFFMSSLQSVYSEFQPKIFHPWSILQLFSLVTCITIFTLVVETFLRFFPILGPVCPYGAVLDLFTKKFQAKKKIVWMDESFCFTQVLKDSLSCALCWCEHKKALRVRWTDLLVPKHTQKIAKQLIT